VTANGVEAPRKRRVILAGAGHAHITALRQFAKRRPDADVFLINDGRQAWYTGALPALIRGDIAAEQAWLDVGKLAETCGASFIDTRFIDFEGNWVELEKRSPMRFDILAVSTGAPMNGGVKPIPKFLARLTLWDRVENPLIGIIGGGAAGVELALALRHRLGIKARITIRAPAGKILETAPVSVQRTVRDELLRARIQVTANFASRMDDIIHAYTPEPTHDITTTLQLTSRTNVFATGDCARFPTPLPRSGAIAVQQGHTLASNIHRLLANQPPKPFRPPPTTLAIVSLNSDEATAWYGPLSWTGHLPMALKSRLDRNWLALG
jgi:selenide,water dikinase